MSTLFSLGATTVAGYRLRTGDTTSEASAVSAALVEAESLLEEELRRLLPLEARTESVHIYPDGRAYPRAYPITVAAGHVIDGRALVGTYPDSGPFIGVFELPDIPRATVTWTGGFDANTLPITLRNAIYDLAYGVINSAVLVSVGSVGGSASVGDVSVGTNSGTSTVDQLARGLSDRVSLYRNRWV